jgi:AraC-like DNA-binding protein
MGNPKSVIPKIQLLRTIKRFLADKDRAISVQLFSELAGISKTHLLDVFENESEPMTEFVQRRVSKAYTEYKNGEVAIMQNRDNTRFVQYRKEAQPQYERSTGLHLVNGQIKIKLGVKAKYDYDDLTLDEQLKGR